MRPAFSVVFLTTLIGAGQGLFLAVFLVHAAARGVDPQPPSAFFVAGSALAAILAVLGLAASFFHLGRPERAWRSAAMWRTSWLAREVIALPAFIAGAAAYGAGHHFGWSATFAVGLAAALASLTLFVCTAMIYTSIRFLQEWASPLTVVNFFLMGCASGFVLAVPVAMIHAPPLAMPIARVAYLLVVAAFLARVASLVRNARLRPRSSLQSATGLGGNVRQISQGFTGRSFNTEEFFHGVSHARMRGVLVAFIALAFIAPAALLPLGIFRWSFGLVLLAFVLQYAGLVLERWYFLAQANHPQNLYYQGVA